MKFEKLTSQFQNAIADAQSLALHHNHGFIEAIHLMKALLDNENSSIKSLLNLAKVDTDTLATRLNQAIDKLATVKGTQGEIHVSNQLNRLLNITEQLATKKGDHYISSELFVLAVADDQGSLGEMLRSLGLKKPQLDSAIDTLRGGEKIADQQAEGQREALKKYTRNLTLSAEKGVLDPVIGRDDEIRRTIQVLLRRTKNNPVLVGEPGVGKTAIVEGLAQRIIQGEVPEGLKKRCILSLDMGSLLAGAKYRGEFEQRLKAVLKDISKNQASIILFIDEIHTIVGAGKTDGALDAGNMLKPALARGDLHCIGATTLNEYRQYIEKDAALERRFQMVLVDEPTEIDAIAILRGLKERYELHHGAQITDDAIIAAVKLSKRYITARKLPDKAIDLIDEAASRIRMEIDSKPEVMDKLERHLIQLKIEHQALNKETDETSKQRLKELDNNINQLAKEYSDLDEKWKAEKAELQDAQQIQTQLEQARLELDFASRNGDLTRMSELQYGEIPSLTKKLQQLNQTKTKASDQPQPNKLIRTKVTQGEIAEVVAKWTHIPISKLLAGEKDKLLNMESLLQQQVIGQNEAVSAIANCIRRSRAGLSDPQKPIGSFMFLGPTGVGKTETCKALAMFLFDTKEAMVRIDMSEFMEKHAVSRLIGAPPGYVGYEQGGYLTELVRRKPYSVILLDEIEKAHPDIFNILLQVLDDGRLTDGQGRTVDFKNTVIVMTANLGSPLIQTMQDKSYQQIKEAVMIEVGKHFRPEFINRLDEIVVFHSLNRQQITAISKIQIDQLKQRLKDKALTLEIHDEVLQHLANQGFDPSYGARPLKRVIQHVLENPLAEAILSGEFSRGDMIFAKLDFDQIRFSKKDDKNN